jgi:beta-glucanase (GH16 family)
MGGSDPHRIDGSLHGPGYSGGSAYTRPFDLDSGHFGDDFHLFAVEWTAEGIRWLVDDNIYHVRTVSGMTANGTTWVFDHPFYFIINLAIGGIYDGNPDPSTVFPQEMQIDYIRVSQLISP